MNLYYSKWTLHLTRGKELCAKFNHRRNECLWSGSFISSWAEETLAQCQRGGGLLFEVIFPHQCPAGGPSLGSRHRPRMTCGSRRPGDGWGNGRVERIWANIVWFAVYLPCHPTEKSAVSNILWLSWDRVHKAPLSVGVLISHQFLL